MKSHAHRNLVSTSIDISQSESMLILCMNEAKLIHVYFGSEMEGQEDDLSGSTVLCDDDR